MENFRRRLINQAETVGLPYLETKRPIFSTKKNFTLRYHKKKKSSTGSLALCVRRQWSLFHLWAAFNEINPLLTVTWDESRRQSLREFRESSSAPHLTHPLTLPKPLSAPPVLVMLRDGRDVGRAASVAECGGVRRWTWKVPSPLLQLCGWSHKEAPLGAKDGGIDGSNLADFLSHSNLASSFVL